MSTARALGRAFADAHDPRRGYGSGTTEVLRLLRFGVHPHDAARSAHGGKRSAGNGAAMRVAPVAVRFAHDYGALTQAARASALVTHAHPIAVDAAVAQAAAVGAALNGDKPLVAALAAATTPELEAGLSAAARLRDSRPEPAQLAAALGNRAPSARARRAQRETPLRPSPVSGAPGSSRGSLAGYVADAER